MNITARITRNINEQPLAPVTFFHGGETFDNRLCPRLLVGWVEREEYKQSDVLIRETPNEEMAVRCEDFEGIPSGGEEVC